MAVPLRSAPTGARLESSGIPSRAPLAIGAGATMKPLVFSLNAMLADMEPLLRRLMTDTVDLAYVQAAGLWPVSAPAGKLEELLLSLAVDAYEAMARDGGTVLVATANVAAPHGLPPGDAVALSVGDSARSTSEAFGQALRGNGRREGLGIRLGYEVAELLGGRLDLLPNGGGGTIVRLLLPRALGGLREAAPVGAGLATGTETVLVVEDDEAVMGVASRALTRLGYGVLTAVSAEAALRLLGSRLEPVHLLVTDITMPGMDGLALARHVRAMSPSIRVLYMTGFSEGAIRMQGMLDPGTPLLQKPFTLETLATLVRQALG